MERLVVLGNKEIENSIFGGYRNSEYTKTLSELTRRYYMTDIKSFFGVLSLDQITLDQIRKVTPSTAAAYRDELKKHGKAIATINRALTSLSSFYKFLCRRDIRIMDYNPFEDIQRIRSSRRSNTRCLVKEEVIKLVRVTMSGRGIEANRNQIIVLMLASNGIRRQELSNIKLGDFKRSMGKDIIEIIGKNDSQFVIVVGPFVMSLINKYLDLRGVSFKDKDEYLLIGHTSNARYFDKKGITPQTVYNVIKKVAYEAGIEAEDVSPHCLRHTFITELLDAGTPIQDVADMIGHANTNTTKRYDHSSRVIRSNASEMLEQAFMTGV